MLRALMAEEPNPVGQIHKIEEMENHFMALVATWDEELEATKSKAWYKPWTWFRRVNLVKVTNFLLRSLDEFIQIVDNAIDSGPDKKATVLDVISRLYDYVIAEALPIWLKPFAAQVKNYIVYVLISSAIDWIVDKYRNGEWREDIPQPQPE